MGWDSTVRMESVRSRVGISVAASGKITLILAFQGLKYLHCQGQSENRTVSIVSKLAFSFNIFRRKLPGDSPDIALKK